MEYFKTNYTNIIKQLSAVLRLSQQEIREKYTDHPICLLEYIDNNIKDKSIEIRFEKELFTITCALNSNEICNAIYLYPDKEETLKEFIDHLNQSYDYNYIKSRWILPDYYIKIKESDQFKDVTYLIFYY